MDIDELRKAGIKVDIDLPQYEPVAEELPVASDVERTLTQIEDVLDQFIRDDAPLHERVAALLEHVRMLDGTNSRWKYKLAAAERRTTRCWTRWIKATQREDALSIELDAVRQACGVQGDGELISYLTSLLAGYEQFEETYDLLDEREATSGKLSVRVSKLIKERDELRAALADVTEYDNPMTLISHTGMEWERAVEILLLIARE